MGGSGTPQPLLPMKTGAGFTGRKAVAVEGTAGSAAFLTHARGTRYDWDEVTRSIVAPLGLTPSVASSTIRARCANPARTDDDRVNDPNCSRSPSRRPSGAERIPHCPARDRQETYATRH